MSRYPRAEFDLRKAARRGVGPRLQRQVGKTPQFFSHVPLVISARTLSGTAPQNSGDK